MALFLGHGVKTTPAMLSCRFLRGICVFYRVRLLKANPVCAEILSGLGVVAFENAIIEGPLTPTLNPGRTSPLAPPVIRICSLVWRSLEVFPHPIPHAPGQSEFAVARPQ